MCCYVLLYVLSFLTEVDCLCVVFLCVFIGIVCFLCILDFLAANQFPNWDNKDNLNLNLN